jgi:hypothetical protein
MHTVKIIVYATTEKRERERDCWVWGGKLDRERNRDRKYVAIDIFWVKKNGPSYLRRIQLHGFSVWTCTASKHKRPPRHTQTHTHNNDTQWWWNNYIYKEEKPVSKLIYPDTCILVSHNTYFFSWHTHTAAVFSSKCRLCNNKMRFN